MPSFSIPLSGLTASSEALSTTANNLANLNTIGYKDEQIQCSDLFYQNFGTNGAGDPIQQGAGVTVASKPSNFTQGNVTPTGVSTDVAIQGNGFFVVEENGVQTYTRAGNTSGGLTTLALGAGTVSPATVTANVSLTSNLDATAAVGSTYSTQATIYDSLGGSHNITVTYTKSATNTWTYAATIPAADITGAAAPVSVASGTLIFNGDGTLKSITPTGGAASLTNPTITVPPVPPVTNPVTPQTVFADGANQLSFTWHVANAGVGLLTQLAGPNSTASIQQDGTSSGTLQNFNIGSDGTITGSFSNGKTATIGQIALASFADEQGLSHQGNNDFTPTLASGQPTIGGPGTGGLGSISGGALEQSNVDIASEFAALIVAQRSYEANARVVTTFDQVAQATIALKP